MLSHVLSHVVLGPLSDVTHLTTDKTIDGNTVIRVSENGWTNQEIGLEWLKHFDQHTE